MATSGTRSFTLTTASLIDEAWERCGKKASELTGEIIVSAIRSLNLLFVDWTNEGVREWSVDEQSQTLTEGDAAYDLPAGTIDILSATLKRDDGEVELYRISREDFRLLHNKTTEGRVDRYFVDKQRDAKVLHVWPEPENSTDQIVYYRLKRIEDATTYGTETLDVSSEWLNAMAAGLASRLAEKWAADREVGLVAKARDAFRLARGRGDDAADLTIRARYGRRR
jgi:hypothetical protein